MIMLARTALMRGMPFFNTGGGPIQFVGANIANMVGPGTFTLSLAPIGMQANDLCIVMMTTESPGAPANAGWTAIDNAATRLAAFWKAMSGTPDTSISWSVIPTGFSAAAIAFAFRNCEVAAGANPIEQVTKASGTSLAPDPPAFDQLTYPDECLVLCAAAEGVDVSVGTPSGGYSTPLVASNAAGSHDAQIAACYQILVGGQHTVMPDPGSFSGWANPIAWDAWSFALIRAGTGAALRELGPDRARYTLEPSDEHRNQQRAREAYTRRKRLLR